MMILKVLQNGQLVASLEVVSGQEYYIGRGSDCHLVLESDRAISRKHLKLFEEEGRWKLELTSRFANLFVDGESTQSCYLDEHPNFSVTPYEFSWESLAEADVEVEAEVEVESEFAEDSHEEVVFENDIEESHDELVFDSEESESEDQTHSAEFDSMTPTPQLETAAESTHIGQLPLVPYLRIFNSKNHEEDVYKLDGSSWIIGRHPTCEIQIEDTSISRRHFEIGRSDNGYTVRDLGSSNGIELNGSPLIAKHTSNIVSGDTLTVKHLQISFELRDPAFESRVKDIVPLVTHAAELDIAAGELAPIEPHMGQGAVRVDDSNSDAEAKKNKLRKLLMFGAPAVLAMAFIFGGGESKEGATDLKSEKSAAPSPEALREAKDLFELARKHYQSAKYEFCLSQIQRLHGLVPSYDTSKDLEKLCKQGLELERINADRDRKERERNESERKITQIVDKCAANVSNFKTTVEAELCLGEALELSPEHPKILEIITKISSREEAAAQKRQQFAARAKRRSSGLSVFRSAKSLQKSGKFKSAIKKYKQFLSSNYGLKDEEASAQKAINDMRSQIAAKAKSALADCNTFIGSQKYRDGILACNKALKIDPNNKEAKSLQNRGLASLKKTMKSMYEDSILEESLGNLDAAKDIWRKIVEQSVPNDSYYRKAKSKLRKYGLEL